MFYSKWAFWVAPNKGEAPDRKPVVRTLKLPSTVWVAELRAIDHVGNCERWTYQLL